jgi:hypothetical protein
MKNKVHLLQKKFVGVQPFIAAKKTLGYLPSVLFFNIFELGAESANQVISNDEASSS